MTFDLFYLLPATGLLWLSLPVAIGKGRNSVYRGRTPNVPVRGVLLAWQNWLDLIRAAAGTYALMNMSVGLQAASQQEAAMAFYIQAAILGAGVLLQSVRWNAGVNIVAPIFYLTGVTLVLPGRTEAVFAVLFAWIFTIGAGDPKFHLPTMGVALATAGYFLDGLTMVLKLTCGLILLPPLLALLYQKGLLFVFRGNRQTRARPATELERVPSRGSSPDETDLQIKSRPSAS